LPEHPPPPEPRRTIGAAISFGTNFTGGMLVFALGGRYLDRRWPSGWSWTLTGMFLGLAYGAYELWKLVRQLNEIEARKQAAPDSKRPKD
jgi:hypothetical protein